jgi:PhnB protein
VYGHFRRGENLIKLLTAKNKNNMAQIKSYLSFDGNCREIMTYYANCLGGELYLQTVGESPVAAQLPPALQDRVMHSSISKNSALLVMGSDMHRDKLIEGNTTTLCVNCGSAEEFNTFFEKLSVGGKVVDPIQKAFWGDTFGVLSDKYGRTWMFVFHEA